MVPCFPGKSADSSGDGGGNDDGIDGHGGAVFRRTAPPQPETRALTTSSPRQQRHRFDLLVPALIEAFAELIDAGDSRIARATSGNKRASDSEAVAVKTSDAEGTAHRHQQPTSSQGKEDTIKMVWDEHWDSQRRTPFFRLRGQNLSVWEIPAL